MYRRSAGMLVAVMLMASACSGHAAGPAPSTVPRFATVILSDDPHGGADKDVFAPNTPKISIRFTLAEVQQGTSIKSDWIEEPDRQMGEESLVAKTPDDEGSFVLPQPVGCVPPPGLCGFPIGAYRVDLFIGGRLATTKHFRVEGTADVFRPQPPGPSRTPGPSPIPGPAASPAPGPSPVAAPSPAPGPLPTPGPSPSPLAGIGPIVFARGVSADVKPIDPTQQFPLGIMQIYAVFQVGGLKADDVIHYVLYWGTDRPVDEQQTATQFFQGAPKQGPHKLTLHRSAPWPLGSYRLELSLNGTVVQTGTFEVVAIAGLGPIVFARDVSPDGTPIGPSTQFPAGIGEISAVFHGAGLKADDVIDAVWYRGPERVGSPQRQTAVEFLGGGQQHGWIIIWKGFSPGWRPGSYRLELSLNGKVVQTGAFEVLPQ